MADTPIAVSPERRLQKRSGDAHQSTQIRRLDQPASLQALRYGASRRNVGNSCWSFETDLACRAVTFSMAQQAFPQSDTQ